jgi:N-acetylmuramoyl-L-alanine amidase
VKIPRVVIFSSLLGLACLGAAQSGQQTTPPAQSADQQQATPPANPAPPQNPSENPPTPASPQATPQVPAPPPVHFGPVVVLDASHGGPDNGARGSGGAIEKDIVLKFAQVVRAELQSQGYRVVMTRTDDSDPSYDDRDAAANMYRDMVYISLHVSTTGTQGTARAYYYQFWAPVTAVTSTSAPAASAAAAAAPAAPAGWISWQEAQRGYADASRRFADDLQSELAKQFGGSPAKSTQAEVRELRSVAGPAAAVEVSNVMVSDPSTLINMAQPLAAAILRGIQDYRPRPAQGGS